MFNNRNSRRAFLRKAPLAAISLPLASALLLDSLTSRAQAAGSAPHTSFQLLTSEAMQEDMHALQGAPGTKNLLEVKGLPLTMVLTVEEKKMAKEFEYHEGRDHIVQVLEGTTLYEMGGVPSTARMVHPQEWLAPASDGAKPFTLKKGDILVIPRGTPHKRSTEGSVTFILISTTGAATV